MHRRILTFIAILPFLSTLYASEIITDTQKLQEIRSKNMVLQDPVLEMKGVIEKPESYIIKLVARSPRGSGQLITAFLDKQTSELYMGTGYDKEGHPITFPKDAQIIKEGVAFSYGSGNKEIYIITDPECPYCTRFEKSIHGKLNEYRVHVILFPLSFHQKAPAMIEWIMQGKNDIEKKKKFETLMLKGSTEYRTLIKDQKKRIKDEKKPFIYVPEPKVKAYLQKSMDASMELRMRGTPAVYDASFEPLTQDQLLNGSKK